MCVAIGKIRFLLNVAGGIPTGEWPPVGRFCRVLALSCTEASWKHRARAIIIDNFKKDKKVEKRDKMRSSKTKNDIVDIPLSRISFARLLPAPRFPLLLLTTASLQQLQ